MTQVKTFFRNGQCFLNISNRLFNPQESILELSFPEVNLILRVTRGYCEIKIPLTLQTWTHKLARLIVTEHFD